MFKAVRGEYGSGKTFFTRWVGERAKRRTFAVAEVQVSETETPLHRVETVYRRLTERLTTASFPPSALRPVVDATRWWTWAGHRANATLTASLGALADPVQRPTDTHVRLRQDLSPADWKTAHAELPDSLTLPTVDPRAVRGLKFSAALPARLAATTLAERLADLGGALATAREPVRREWHI